MKQLPETIGEARDLTGIQFPESLLSLPITTSPVIIARRLAENGQQQTWRDIGGINLWTRRTPTELDDAHCRELAAKIGLKKVGSPMRANLKLIADAEEHGIKVSKASIGNTDHQLHPLLSLLGTGLHYSDFGGPIQLRQAIALLHRHFGWAVSSLSDEHIFGMAGTAYAIPHVFETLLLRPYDAPPPSIGVVADEGVWPNVNDAVSGVRAKQVNFNLSDDLDRIVAGVDLVYIIHPAIFGKRRTLKDLRRLVRACRMHRRHIVVDAVYQAFEDPLEHVSLVREFPEGTIEVGSLSKEYAAGKIHTGSIKCLNPHTNSFLIPALQQVLCFPTIPGLHDGLIPLVLLTSADYMAGIREIYERKASEVTEFKDRLARFGVTIDDRDVGPYVVIRSPFPSTRFNAWMVGEFRTRMPDDQIWTGVGTAMPVFFPGSDQGTNAFRVAAVQADGQTRWFMEILCRAVPGFMVTHQDVVDWSGIDREFVMTEGEKYLKDMPSN